MMKISFESTFTVLLESFVFNLNVKVKTVEGQIRIAVLFEKKNYVMVLLHFPLKNFERTWKRSQTQGSGNEKSETRSSEKLDRQNLKRDREWRRYRSLDASNTCKTI